MRLNLRYTALAAVMSAYCGTALGRPVQPREELTLASQQPSLPDMAKTSDPLPTVPTVHPAGLQKRTPARRRTQGRPRVNKPAALAPAVKRPSRIPVPVKATTPRKVTGPAAVKTPSKIPVPVKATTPVKITPQTPAKPPVITKPVAGAAPASGIPPSKIPVPVKKDPLSKEATKVGQLKPPGIAGGKQSGSAATGGTAPQAKINSNGAQPTTKTTSPPATAAETTNKKKPVLCRRADDGGCGEIPRSRRPRTNSYSSGSSSLSSFPSSRLPWDARNAETFDDLRLVEDSRRQQGRLQRASYDYNQGSRDPSTYSRAPSPDSHGYGVRRERQAPQEDYTRQPQNNDQWYRQDTTAERDGGATVQRTYTHPSSGTLVNSFSSSAADPRARQGSRQPPLRASALSANAYRGASRAANTNVPMRNIFRDQITDTPTTSSDGLPRDTRQAINNAVRGMGHTGRTDPLTLQRNGSPRTEYHRSSILATSHGRHSMNTLYDHPQDVGGGRVIGDVTVHPERPEGSIGSPMRGLSLSGSGRSRSQSVSASRSQSVSGSNRRSSWDPSSEGSPATWGPSLEFEVRTPSTPSLRDPTSRSGSSRNSPGSGGSDEDYGREGRRRSRAMSMSTGSSGRRSSSSAPYLDPGMSYPTRAPASRSSSTTRYEDPSRYYSTRTSAQPSYSTRGYEAPTVSSSRRSAAPSSYYEPGPSSSTRLEETSVPLRRSRRGRAPSSSETAGLDGASRPPVSSRGRPPRSNRYENMYSEYDM